ncbi:hypothetical protein BaRGS_00037868, partial [Batillaria attramentaria]
TTAGGRHLAIVTLPRQPPSLDKGRSLHAKGDHPFHVRNPAAASCTTPEQTTVAMRIDASPEASGPISEPVEARVQSEATGLSDKVAGFSAPKAGNMPDWQTVRRQASSRMGH